MGMAFGRRVINFRDGKRGRVTFVLSKLVQVQYMFKSHLARLAQCTKSASDLKRDQGTIW